MPESPDPADTPTESATPAPQDVPRRPNKPAVHQVEFVSYPKLLFVWPVILAGLVFYPFGGPTKAPAGTDPTVAVATEPATGEDEAAADETPKTEAVADARLGWLGWIYLWIVVVVALTLGLDVGRNQFIFWIVVFALIWVLGLWLRDNKGFTLFGDIYRWFEWLGVQYNRGFGLSLSLILLAPYVIMLLAARLNDQWRITHNEFEHYSFGKMDDSLGRGAKTIRTSFPDVLELLLGGAGTLIVFNATGTRELRRIPHVMFLPLVRKRLNKILERTAITTAEMEEEEEEDDL